MYTTFKFGFNGFNENIWFPLKKSNILTVTTNALIALLRIHT